MKTLQKLSKKLKAADNKSLKAFKRMESARKKYDDISYEYNEIFTEYHNEKLKLSKRP